MPAETRPPARGRPARLTSGVLTLALALAACSSPTADPRAVGSKDPLCDGRLTQAIAERIAGRPVQDLRELNTFTAGVKVGQCTLADADGAVVDLTVVADPGGQELAGVLHELNGSPNFTGDARSAGAGEGREVQGYAAVDANHYARVLGNAGSTEDQRITALTLAKALAAYSAGLK